MHTAAGSEMPLSLLLEISVTWFCTTNEVLLSGNKPSSATWIFKSSGGSALDKHGACGRAWSDHSLAHKSGTPPCTCELLVLVGKQAEAVAGHQLVNSLHLAHAAWKHAAAPPGWSESALPAPSPRETTTAAAAQGWGSSAEMSPWPQVFHTESASERISLGPSFELEVSPDVWHSTHSLERSLRNVCDVGLYFLEYIHHDFMYVCTYTPSISSHPLTVSQSSECVPWMQNTIIANPFWCEELNHHTLPMNHLVFWQNACVKQALSSDTFCAQSFVSVVLVFTI